MARKVANGVNKKLKRASTSHKSETNLPEEERNFSTGSGADRFSGSADMIREWINNPAVKYIAGGIATAILSRVAQNMSEKYPELARFLKENIDTFEGRLGQYRPGFESREERA